MSLFMVVSSNTVHGPTDNGKGEKQPGSADNRDAIQTAFAPPFLFHSEPKEWLNPGDTRVYTNMIVNVLLAEETTLRIPTREPSKVSLYTLTGSLTYRTGALIQLPQMLSDRMGG